MKFEIILAIMWANLCVCERQQRSTVLTDESKRILEHFDFSNFDKQEALNYLDRQRYDNQIRGKRSHSKFKREHNTRENEKGLGADVKPEDLRKSNEELRTQIFQKDDPNNAINLLLFSEFPSRDHEYGRGSETTAITTRHKRGHRRSQKKHRSKSRSNDEGENDERKHSQKKKKKKKKKKKRHYWNDWTEWSPCSVTCGRGRKIRWRKCIAKNCKTGELEMGEKTCQLPACNLFTKLLGL